MAKITYPDKNTGDQFFATEATEIKTSVNLLHDANTGTNTGDQTSIVGITGTKAQFDTAVTDGNIMYIGDAPTAHTHTFASLTSKPTTLSGYSISDTKANFNTALSDGSFIFVGDAPTAHTHTFASLTSKPTTLSGYSISDTKANFNTALSDGSFIFVGDAPTSHTHLLAAGATDVTASAAELNILDLSATALTIGWGYFADGASAASWRKLLGSEITNDQSWAADQTSIADFTGTMAQFDTAVTDGNIMYVGDAPTSHTHLLTAGATDVNATAAELNILDLSATALTIGWGYFADGASAASWRKLLGSEITNDQSWAADQTTIVGITGTKAQFDTAVTDGNIMYIGDAPTSHTHLLAAGATDVNATAAELNVLDLSATSLTIGWVYSADGVSTASWRKLLTSELTNDSGWAADQTITLTGDVTGTGTGSFGTTIAAGAVDIAMLSATGSPDATNFLRGDGTWNTPAGSGDMVLASAQTNSGIKTFLDTTMKLRNVANTFDGYFVNTNTANRIYTLQDSAGTVAFTSDITGTNSGTNTGDELAASLTVVGVVELATVAETNTGTDATRAVTPDGLNDWTGGAGAITKLGTIATGVWQGTAINQTYLTGQSGTNTGDQTTIVGITGTKAQFDTAVTDGNIMYIGDAPTSHNHAWGDITSGTPTTLSGYGISDTKANFNTACSDGSFIFVGDAPTAHTHALSAGATDVTATAAEVNLLDLGGLTAGYVLSADTASTASWKAQTGGSDPTLKASVTIVDPVAADDATLFFTPVAITVTAVNSHITGTTNVVFNINHASTRNGTGLDVFTADITLTTVSGQTNSSGFNDATIPANSWVWLDVVSVSGTPTMFHTTVTYTED